MSLPEYLKLTLFGQRVQRIEQLHTEPPQWVSKSLIYSTDSADPVDSDDEDMGDEQPEHISITSPQRLYFDSHSTNSERSLPTSWKLDGLHDQIIARNGMVSVSSEVTENKEIMFIANASIPPLCGVWYYEVTLDEKCTCLMPVMIGLCSSVPGRPIRYSGTQGQCWLYFSDDGRAMPSNGSARKYGPKFGPGDTIGCGVNFATSTVFYTKNGIDIGTAFTKIRCSLLHPFISAHSGAILHTNFGARDFMFDIVNYVQSQKRLVFAKVDGQKVDRSVVSATTNTDPEATDDELVFGLVESYLQHMGYTKSLTALRASAGAGAESHGDGDSPSGSASGERSDDPQGDSQDEELLTRLQIRTLITNHEFDQVQKLLKDRWPDISPEILFDLECQKMATAVRAENIPRALEIGKSLQKSYGAHEPFQEPLKLLYGTLAYPRSDGGAPWEDELYGPRALAELVFRTIQATSGQYSPEQLPYLLKRTIAGIEDYAQENPEAALVNVFSDIFGAEGENRSR